MNRATAAFAVILGMVLAVFPQQPIEAQPGTGQSAPVRERINLRRPPPLSLEGRVVAASADVISTSVSSGLLYTGDLVLVHISGRTLRTRFLEASAYATLREDPTVQDGLDADVVCTPDASGSVLVIGLGGDIADWLKARPNMRVVLERP